MKHCFSCGNAMDGNMAVCLACGAPQPPAQPPRKKRTGLAIGLILTGVAVAAGVPIALAVINSSGESHASNSAPSVIAEISNIPRPAQPSSAAPHSSQAGGALPSARTFAWLVEPQLAYDSIEPVPNYTGDSGLNDRIRFHSGDMSGIAWFSPDISDGVIVNPIIGLYRNRLEPQGLYICEMIGGVHGLPPEIEALSREERDVWLAEKGIPYPACIGHGGPNSPLYARTPDGGITLCQIDFGYLFYKWPPEWVQNDNIPDILPVFDAAPLLNEEGELPAEQAELPEGAEILYGLADSSGNILLDMEYDYIYRLMNGVYVLRQGDKIGYYSAERRTLISGCFYDALWEPMSHPNGGAGAFSEEGLCPVSENGKCGVIDEDGRVVVPPVFDGISHVYAYTAWVKYNGIWGLIEITH